MSRNIESPEASVVCPAYNEEANLSALFERLRAVFDKLGVGWEWIVVDDHSTDATPDLMHRLSADYGMIRSIRFSRNFGSHAAIAAGLKYSRGKCVVVMAADLQDPPEIIPDLLQRWQDGARTVWAVRRYREGEPWHKRLFSRMYHRLLQAITPLKEMPLRGADMWLMDRRVVDAFNADPERHASVTALVRWIGFRQDSVEYVKQARTRGRSGWTLSKKVKHLADTAISFSYLPMRIMSGVGSCVALLGFVYALVVIVNAILRKPVQGYPSLMVAVLVIGGVQMLMMGVLGEYLWRTLDESRRRPRFIIEESTEKGSESERQSDGENPHAKP